ncbi:MAG: malonyl-CoA synthase [Paracoccaceae bacterium]|jgi:malonyl-CoA/methylmalonyl-CoA synthetase
MNNLLFDSIFAPHAGLEKPFLYLPLDQLITYDRFLKTVATFAHCLEKGGLRPGDIFAVQVEKSMQALAVYGACVQSGVVFLPLNTAYTANELLYFVKDSGAKMFLADDSKLSMLKAVFAGLDLSIKTMSSDGSGSFTDLAASMPESFATVARRHNDLAALLYTSGTTGRSKGVMLSHENLLSNAKVLSKHWSFSSQDVLLHALPIFHTHGLFVASNVILASGASMIFLPKFDIGKVIAAFPKATTMMGVPTFYTRLLDEPRFDRELVDHMRLFVSGSAPLLAETHHQFDARTGHCILERYGMTETNMNTSNPYEGVRRAGTVGMPLPGVELIITDPSTGTELPNGTVGQIEVRGPNVFSGYWKMPEKTREERRENGFFITGDLGLVDQDGYVQIAGRNKDLVISGGYNIYPKEIELILDKKNGVLESAVIGAPHADLGESPVAVLVQKHGETIDIARIQIELDESLARFKQPRAYFIVDELPRNTMAKVQKNILRDLYREAFLV